MHPDGIPRYLLLPCQHNNAATVVSVGQANSNGFGLVRQLSTEFSLRSRGEALTLI